MTKVVALLASWAATDIGAAIQHMKRNVVLYVVAGFLAVSAWALGLTTLAMWLSTLYGPVVATGGIAAALAITAVLLLIAVAILKRRDARQKTSSAIPALAGAAALGIAPSFIRSRPILSIALAAGMAFGGAKLAQSLQDDNS